METVFASPLQLAGTGTVQYPEWTFAPQVPVGISEDTDIFGSNQNNQGLIGSVED